MSLFLRSKLIVLAALYARAFNWIKGSVLIKSAFCLPYHGSLKVKISFAELMHNYINENVTSNELIRENGDLARL